MDISYIKEFYDFHLKKYGSDDNRAMGWFDEEEINIRFEIITKGVDLNHSSILDVGCGFGGLYTYLIAENIKPSKYLGVDIMPKMIEIANQKCPTGTFQVKDILKDPMEPFDYLFCIGTLNITTDDFSTYFLKMIDKMIEIANKAVAINFLSDKEYLMKGPYHFENPQRLKKLVEQKHDVKVVIINDERMLGESFLFIYKN